VEFPQAPLNAAIPQAAIPQAAIPQAAIPQAPRFGGVVAAPPESPASPPASPFAAAPTSAAPAVTVEPGRLAASESLPAPVLPAPAAGPAAAAPGPRGRTALGVRTLPIDAVTQARFNLPRPAGAYVVGVVQDLPASKAGVPPGSVIVSLGDRPVRSPLELAEMVTTGPVDRPTTLEFVLPGGQSRRAEVVLQSLEAPLERALVGGAEPATAVPALEPGPTPARAERPVTFDTTLLRDEIRRLRTRLDQLERTLEASAR
jgi:membrane-associated protease RseP (regulator of RpoE activity)